MNDKIDRSNMIWSYLFLFLGGLAIVSGIGAMVVKDWKYVVVVLISALDTLWGVFLRKELA